MRQLAALLLLLLGLTSLVHGQDFYNWDVIPEIRITFEQENWAEILENMKENGDKDRLVGKVEINGKVFEGVGVRYKGNSSYFNVKNSGASKLPLNLEADTEDDDQEFTENVTTIKLSNIFRDPSFLREVLSYEIAGKYMPAPCANFAKVYVNGKYMGLYNNTQSIDKRLLKRYFDNKDGIFFKCDPEWGGKKEIAGCEEGDKASLMYLGNNPQCYLPYYELKSDTGWTELIDLTRVLNEEPENIESILDVDQTLWMLAFNNVLVNLDSYTGRLCHNYYLYRLPSGQFFPIVWDMNLSLGGFAFAGLGQALSLEEMQTMSPLIHYKQKNPKRPLIVKLLDNPLYRKIYIGHMWTILQENFTNGAYLERAKEWQALIAEEVIKDTNKLYDVAGFEKNLQSSTKAGSAEIPGIVELMEKRTESLSEHPLFQNASVIEKVEHLQFDNTLAIQATLQGAEKAYVAYRTDPKAPFVRMELFDDGGHNDEVLEDNIWGATLDYVPGLQYYIISEGDRNATLSPARAAFEFYTVE